MDNLDFNNKKKIHFTGIGGISMSALAEIMLSRGFEVTGSDNISSDLTKHLEELGAKVSIGQRAENITDDIDLVVYTAAVKLDNPELVKAKEKNIPIMSRAAFLGEIMKNYNPAICVAGTHGKTTTTSMLAQILMSADMDPTILVGGIMPAIKGNVRVGQSNTMITEACEYTNSFLEFSPTVGIILNIEEDHLDFFKDIEDIRNSFRKFAELIPEDGYLIINRDIDDYEGFIDGLKCNIATFGTDPSNCDFCAENVNYTEGISTVYDLLYKGKNIARVHMTGVGAHNVQNSLAAFAAADALGIKRAFVAEGIQQYSGTERRFEFKGLINDNIKVIDDYAHHPMEIIATLSTMDQFDYNKLWVVFQPHTYLRTQAFLTEFAEALTMADAVVLADIYAAREKNTIGISSKDLLKEIDALGTEAYYFPTFEEIENFLLKNLQPNDLLITMGAGDVVEIGNHLTGK